MAIIEDDDLLREELAEELRFRGHEVFVAANGHVGFGIIAKALPDIVLSDIDMPIENGYALMRRVRAEDQKYAEMSFLFLSGRNQPKEVSYGLEIGADDYILKPIEFDFLCQKIDSIMRKKNRVINSVLATGTESQTKEASLAAFFFMGAIFILGFLLLLLLYFLKAGLGIDIFKDSHLGDLFGF